MPASPSWSKALVFALVVSFVGTGPSPAAAAPPSPTISINNVTMEEGNSGTKVFFFTVQLKGKRAANVQVDYASAPGTASADSDYKTTAGTITFASGKRQRIAVPVFGDTAAEANETFSVNLTNATGATIATSAGVGTIQDDDPMPSVSISDAVLGEGNSGSTTASFRVTLSNPTTSEVQVGYATGAGTATSPADYTAESGTVTLAPGETVQNLGITVWGDTEVEGDHNFTVTLSDPVGATIADNSGVGTIIDDESAPAVSIEDAQVSEGDSGAAALGFTVTLSHADSTQAVTVPYAAEDVSASRPGDYELADGSLVFEPSQVSKVVTVSVKGDQIDEPDEVFRINLGPLSNAVPADVEGTGTIADDDATPAVSISDRSIREGNKGTKVARFTITLSGASGAAVVVGYETSGGSATAPEDYLSANTSVTLPPGVVSKEIDVAVVGDRIVEPKETFSVDVRSTTNAELSDGLGGGTIADNDTATVVKVAKRAGRIRVRGQLTPAHARRRMVVTLFKKKGTRFVKVRTKRPRLWGAVDVNNDGLADSRYRVGFANPRRTRRCRVVVVFPGDGDHGRSRARKTFAC